MVKHHKTILYWVYNLEARDLFFSLHHINFRMSLLFVCMGQVRLITKWILFCRAGSLPCCLHQVPPVGEPHDTALTSVGLISWFVPIASHCILSYFCQAERWNSCSCCNNLAQQQKHTSRAEGLLGAWKGGCRAQITPQHLAVVQVPASCHTVAGKGEKKGCVIRFIDKIPSHSCHTIETIEL